MPVLRTFKRYFGFGNVEADYGVTYAPTMDDRLGEAAANRGYAFELLADAEEALREAAQTEAEVAEEAARTADRAIVQAREFADQILAQGQEKAARYNGTALLAQDNAYDDSRAATVLASLVSSDADV